MIKQVNDDKFEQKVYKVVQILLKINTIYIAEYMKIEYNKKIKYIIIMYYYIEN